MERTRSYYSLFNIGKSSDVCEFIFGFYFTFEPPTVITQSEKLLLFLPLSSSRRGRTLRDELGVPSQDKIRTLEDPWRVLEENRNWYFYHIAQYFHIREHITYYFIKKMVQDRLSSVASLLSFLTNNASTAGGWLV